MAAYEIFFTQDTGLASRVIEADQMVKKDDEDRFVANREIAAIASKADVAPVERRD